MDHVSGSWLPVEMVDWPAVRFWRLSSVLGRGHWIWAYPIKLWATRFYLGHGCWGMVLAVGTFGYILRMVVFCFLNRVFIFISFILKLVPGGRMPSKLEAFFPPTLIPLVNRSLKFFHLLRMLIYSTTVIYQ